MSETSDNRIHEDAHEAFVEGEGEEEGEINEALKGKIEQIESIEDPIEQQDAADDLSDDE